MSIEENTSGSGIWVVANRTDGLGARLRAVVNGLWIAAKLDVPFKLEWFERPRTQRLFHSVVAAKSMFSADFLQRYHVAKRLRPQELRPIYSNVTSLQELKREPGADFKGWIAGMSEYEALVSSIGESVIDSRAQAFSMIEFHPTICEYMELARNVPLPENPAAVHLRAGDIVYGNHRKKGNVTDKVIALPVVKRLIERLQQQGHSVVLYGQDDAVLQYLKREYGAVLGRELLPEQHPASHHEAMFEVATMARCNPVIAGESNFPVLACWMAGIEKTGPEELFSGEEQAEIIMEDMSRNAALYPPLQTAFAYWSAYFWGKASMAPEVMDAMLKNAYAYDPENGLYQIIRLWNALAKGDYVCAEHILSSVFVAHNLNMHVRDVPLITALLAPDLKNAGVLRHRGQFHRLGEMADMGSCYGAAFNAISKAARGDQAGAAAALDVARQRGLSEEWYAKLVLELQAGDLLDR